MKIKHLLFTSALLCFLAVYAQEIDPQNLLKNSSFEYGTPEAGKPPDDWGFITKSAEPVNGGMTDAVARTGKYSVRLAEPANSNDQWEVLAYNLPVEVGAVYKFSAWIKSDPQKPLAGNANGRISIEWKDANGDEISRSVSEPWTANTLQVSKEVSKDWTEVQIQGIAPPNTQTASFVITYYARIDNPATGGAFLIDDALVVKVNK